MAADHDSVKLESPPTGESPEDKPLGVSPSERVPPGITVEELIAAVGNLKLPDSGFADALEAVQAEQPLAEMPKGLD
jgi:hypothetical protein